MGLHVFPIPIPPPTSLSTRLILLLKDVRKIDLNETLSYGRDYGTLEADKWFSTSGGAVWLPKEHPATSEDAFGYQNWKEGC